MARYDREFGGYGRDFGRWRQGPQYGGMRSDGWGSDWRSFPGEEGWLGEGYEGMPNSGYDQPFRGDRDLGRFSQGGYGNDFRSRGASHGAGGWGSGYPARESGYGGGREMQGYGGGRSGGTSGQFGRTRVAEIMTPDPKAVTPDTKVSEVAKAMRDLDVGIIPVVESADSRRLKGVITDRDIAVRAVADGRDGNTTVSECMTQSVRCVNKNDSVRDVMQVMRRDQVRRVPVIDREGRLVGIIAQADLAVDYAADDHDREMEVGSVLEGISEPARPERNNRMAAQGRSRKQSTSDTSE
jgi:CBS domain-containing protein